MHAVALTGLLFQLVSGAPAAAAVDERTEYYEITGSTAQELRRAMDRLRPTDAKGRRFDGHTRWDVRWRYQLTSGERSCALKEFGTSVQIVVTLPNWSGRPAGFSSRGRGLRHAHATWGDTGRCLPVTTPRPYRCHRFQEAPLSNPVSSGRAALAADATGGHRGHLL